MFCSNCGAELKDNANFCSNCGQAITSGTSTSSASSDDEVVVKEGLCNRVFINYLYKMVMDY